MHLPKIFRHIACASALLASAHDTVAQLLLAKPLNGGPALVIGHRGASGYRPEHTLEAYDLAIMLGANFIEPDLVSTKDGVLVARHENAIAIVNADGSLREATTNVHTLPEFASRKTTKSIDGVSITGWFTEDFTLAELKTLRARERIPANRPANTAYNDRYQVPTLQEVIELAKAKSTQLGRTIGVYPETKHPSYFKSIGLSLEDQLVQILHASYGNTRNAPVYIQSFEVSNLQELRGKTTLKLVQLLSDGGRPWDFTVKADARTYADLVSPTGLAFIKTYADGIGPAKTLIIPRKTDNTLGTPTTLVANAHAQGLVVHPYTFRAENSFLPVDYRVGTDPNAHGNLRGEIAAYLATGIDGFFTDQSDFGVAAVNAPQSTRLAAVSVRGQVAAGKPLILGFVVQGGSKQLLLRAAGPSLAPFGLTGVLADPKLAVFAGAGQIAENDTWAAALSSVFSANGAFAYIAGSKEAALTAVLAPGAYTVQVASADGTAGETLVEAYEVP